MLHVEGVEYADCLCIRFNKSVCLIRPSEFFPHTITDSQSRHKYSYGCRFGVRSSQTEYVRCFFFLLSSISISNERQVISSYPRRTHHKLLDHDLAFDSRKYPPISGLAPTLIGATARGGGTSADYRIRVGQPPACITARAV